MKNYKEEAEKLSKAIDIAIEAFKLHPPPKFEPVHIDQAVRSYNEMKKYCINPEPKFANLKSLKYTEQAVFTYFNEATPSDCTNYFWDRVRKFNLGYERKDILAIILKRGKIKDHPEYEYVTDTMVAAVQEGRISEHEYGKLSKMIGDFENLAK